MVAIGKSLMTGLKVLLPNEPSRGIDVGMTIVIIIGGIDLSMGSVVGLIIMGVSSFWQMVIKGLVIAAAVVLDQAQSRLQARVALAQESG